jgi:hypothetical protein
MAAPRFKLRSLALLIVFLGLVLAIGVLTVRIARLERELQVVQERERMARLEAREALRLAELEELRAQEALSDAQAKSALNGK